MLPAPWPDLQSRNDARIERSVATLRQIVNGAINANQASEDAAIVAAEGGMMFRAIEAIEQQLDYGQIESALTLARAVIAEIRRA